MAILEEPIKNLEIIKSRVDCYLSHNHTVIAKQNSKIIGVLQWQIKADPNFGIVEFEEFHVLKKYRNKGIGTELINYAIQSVINCLNKLKIKPRKIFLFVNRKNVASDESSRDSF